MQPDSWGLETIPDFVYFPVRQISGWEMPWRIILCEQAQRNANLEGISYYLIQWQSVDYVTNIRPESLLSKQLGFVFIAEFKPETKLATLAGVRL